MGAFGCDQRAKLQSRGSLCAREASGKRRYSRGEAADVDAALSGYSPSMFRIFLKQTKQQKDNIIKSAKSSIQLKLPMWYQ